MSILSYTNQVAPAEFCRRSYGLNEPEGSRTEFQLPGMRITVARDTGRIDDPFHKSGVGPMLEIAPAVGGGYRVAAKKDLVNALPKRRSLLATRESEADLGVAGLLSMLDSVSSEPNIRTVLSQVRRLLQESGSAVAVRIAKRKLGSRSLSPRKRRGLIEILVQAGAVDLVPAILDELAGATADEYVLGCAMMLRLVKVRADEWGSVAPAIRTRLTALLQEPGCAPGLRANIVRQLTLALGSFGHPDDTELLVSILEKDREWLYGEAVVGALSLLFSNYPDSIPTRASARLCDLGDTLLRELARPAALMCPDIFSRVSRVLEALCARMYEPEVQCALEHVRKSEDEAITIRMASHLRTAWNALAARGKAHWESQTETTFRTALMELRKIRDAQAML